MIFFFLYIHILRSNGVMTACLNIKTTSLNCSNDKFKISYTFR